MVERNKNAVIPEQQGLSTTPTDATTSHQKLVRDDVAEVISDRHVGFGVSPGETKRILVHPELGIALLTNEGRKGNNEDAGFISADGKRMAIIDGMGGGKKAAEFAAITKNFAERFLRSNYKRGASALGDVCQKVCSNVHRIDQGRPPENRFNQDKDGAIIALVDSAGDSIDIAIVGDAEVVVVDETLNQVVLRTRVQNVSEDIIAMARQGNIHGLFEMALDGDFAKNPYGFRDSELVTSLARKFSGSLQAGAPIDEADFSAFRQAYGKAVVTNTIDAGGSLAQDPLTYSLPKEEGHSYKIYAMSDGAGEFLDDDDFLTNLGAHMRELNKKVQQRQASSGHFDHATIGVITG